MQLTTLVIIFGSFFSIQNVLGAPLIEADVVEIGRVVEEANFLEEMDVGAENVQQRIGAVGGNINNDNASKVRNHSTIIEIEDEEDPVFGILPEEDRVIEEDVQETITETEVMDIDVEVDEPEVKYPHGYHHRHGRYPH